jgi:hypothetical protein
LKPDDIFYGYQFEIFLLNYKYDLTELFPDYGWEKPLLSKYFIKDGDYCTVHIRKGDFITQASYLVNDLSYIKLLRSLNLIISKNIFIVSDEYLGESLEEQIKDALTYSKVYQDYLHSLFPLSPTDFHLHLPDYLLSSDHFPYLFNRSYFDCSPKIHCFFLYSIP